MSAVEATATVNPKAEADLVRSVQLTKEIGRTRKKVTQLIAQRDALWRRMNDAGITQQRIAQACEMTTDSVYQGIRRAMGRPVRRGGRDDA